MVHTADPGNATILPLKQVGRGEGSDNLCLVRDAFCSCDNIESGSIERAAK
jgi:hypothetical protein